MPRQDPGEPYYRVSSDEANTMREADPNSYVLIDVRRDDEWVTGHPTGAIHIPIDDLPGRIGEVPQDKKVLFICAAGVRSGLACEIETLGFNPAADWSLTFDPESRRVALSHKGALAAEYTCPMPGDHSALNSAMAFALAESLGADRESIVRAFKSFKGIGRRLELLGDRPMPTGGIVRVYDDYGHHPTEVEMTLRALRQHERPHDHGGRLVCVFQPHQHSRTRFLLDDFAAAFGQADVVIVPHIYFVRDSEAEKQKVSAGDLVDRLRSRGTRAMHLYPFDAIVEQVEETCRAGDLLVVMGAGPVWTIAHSFMERAPSPVAQP